MWMWDNTFEIMSQTIMDFYRVVLGQNIFDKEPFIKANDPDVNVPMLIISNNPIVIRTCAENSGYWCQFYYQFGHELTHYIFRQFKHDKNRILKWFEETVCEAMALYIMKYISDDWPKNPLHDINKNYNNSILDYINNELKKLGTEKLHICNNIETLTEIEITSEECREDRYFERNFLYDLFIASPEQIDVVFYYENFLEKNKLLINFTDWIIEHKNNVFLNNVRKIQPNISMRV